MRTVSPPPAVVRAMSPPAPEVRRLLSPGPAPPLAPLLPDKNFHLLIAGADVTSTPPVATAPAPASTMAGVDVTSTTSAATAPAVVSPPRHGVTRAATFREHDR